MSVFLVGEIEKAAQCTGTYLYLNPGQEDMMGNEEYYKEVEGVKEKWFLPREEAVAYVERDQDEEALLNFIENNYSSLTLVLAFCEGSHNSPKNKFSSFLTLYIVPHIPRALGICKKNF